ncbi:MAG: phage Gp19/Gp15/Gp42 family protein [Oscillospiraceae bacterium]|nr:phage Gp19/Gp15/Gp42 family protein [Oscillospiraceae bacterium]
MSSYATVEDITSLWRTLTTEEQERAEALLPVVSDLLRQAAMNVGKDLDAMIEAGLVLANVVKSVTVDITARALMTSTDTEPMSQMSQSALGYSVSGTYLVPGGGIYIKKSELARLGLSRQRLGVIDLAGPERHHGCAGSTDTDGDG